ncbi:hypothetical protein OOJ96_01110 [Pseudomonas sp. 15FMM2]|uniref:Uncharacterized protein n=1 Tax=Pseudomonas imrae TaxID=2992837 RepID=A0ACC7P8G0_9PSED
MTPIEKPSELPLAIGQALRVALPDLQVGSAQDFQATNKTCVVITVERNGPAVRSLEGRKAHVLSVLLKVMVGQGAQPFEACDLASRLMDLVLDNRWNLPPTQCEVPMNIVAVPSTLAGAETDYDAWTVSFTQTLYLGPPLLEDPTGTPLFACTWEVSDIDDPDQYQPIAGATHV